MAESSPKIAIVTGTSTGVGEAVARALLDRGWRVVGIARRPAPMSHAAYRHIAYDLADVAAEFPWVGIFLDFEARGLAVPPARPAADIVAFLESNDQPGFSERRLQS